MLGDNVQAPIHMQEYRLKGKFRVNRYNMPLGWLTWKGVGSKEADVKHSLWIGQVETGKVRLCYEVLI